MADTLAGLRNNTVWRGANQSRAPIPRATHQHRMPFGAELLDSGGVRFRLWAPTCQSIQVSVDGGEPMPMAASEAGWHEREIKEAGAGSSYRFVLPDGSMVPDPASRFQPHDVRGPSEVIDPDEFVWRATEWTGRPWHETVIYELHVGSFTQEGTFRAALTRLDYLKDLGITAIEIMPVADFPGSRSWGYDGVLFFAPDSSYGRPEDLKAFIDAAHERGLQVLLDVVYNHFGPDGNHLPVYAPEFFTNRHHTPWGSALNFDGAHSATVREFIIHNALYWLEEFQLDGLRLDAVHAIIDDSEQHVLKELAVRARALGRPVHLLLENEENQASLLTRASDSEPEFYTAQWNDDVHHVLHVAATAERHGYYSDYSGNPELLGRALAQGFAFQGQMLESRGTPRGEPSNMLSPTAFVAFIQNHDQVGNRAFGERLSLLASPDAIRAIAAVYLLLPQIPLLFMGEEWGAKQPFPYFSDFDGELAEKVREGRRQEFAKFPDFQDEKKRAQIPDPGARATFNAAKLNWADLQTSEHVAWHKFYQRLLAARRELLMPMLPSLQGYAARYRLLAPSAVLVCWSAVGSKLQLSANLSGTAISGFPSPGRLLWREGTASSDGGLGPWSVEWSLVKESS